jgi:hypothetical protein
LVVTLDTPSPISADAPPDARFKIVNTPISPTDMSRAKKAKATICATDWVMVCNQR